MVICFHATRLYGTNFNYRKRFVHVCQFMVLSVRVVKGKWVEREMGIWDHEPDLLGNTHTVTVKETTDFHSLVNIVKQKYGLREIDGIELTYQWPNWMLGPDWIRAVPINIVDDEDTALFVAIRADLEEVFLHVRVIHFGMESNVNSFTSTLGMGSPTTVLEGFPIPAYHYVFPNQPPQYGFYRPLSNGGIIWPGNFPFITHF